MRQTCELDSLVFVYVQKYMRGCRYYFEFGDEDVFCDWIEDVQRSTLKLMYIIIIDS